MAFDFSNMRQMWRGPFTPATIDAPQAPRALRPDMMGINPATIPGRGGMAAPPSMGINPPQMPPGGGWRQGPGMPSDMMGINPPQMPPGGGWRQGSPQGFTGRVTNSGYVLPSLQDLLGKYASWAMQGGQQRGGMGANPPGTGGPGYSLRGPNGGTNLYDGPMPGNAPPNMGIPGGPGYSLRGPNGGTNLYDASPVQRPEDGQGVVIGGPSAGFGGPGYSLGGNIRFGENGPVVPGGGGPGGARQLPPEMMGISPPKQGSIAPIGGPGFGARMTIQGGMPSGMMGIMKQEDPGGGNYGPPPTNKYPPGYPGIGTIPGTGPLPPPTGTIGGGTAPTQPNPVLGPVNPNLPPAPGKSPTWPGYGGGSAWPPGWTPPTPTPKPGAPVPTPAPKTGGGGGGGGYTPVAPPPAQGGGGGGGGGSSAPADNGFGTAPDPGQLAYMRYLWEQQQWGDKNAQDAARLAWEKEQYGTGLGWDQQKWYDQYGLQQDQFGLSVLKNQQDYGLAQDQFGLNALGMGLNQDQFGLSVLDWQAKQGQQDWQNQFNQGQFDWSKQTNARDFSANQAQLGWQNQFNTNQFDWQKQMDAARNDITREGQAYAAFGRRFGPNVGAM